MDKTSLPIKDWGCFTILFHTPSPLTVYNGAMIRKALLTILSTISVILFIPTCISEFIHPVAWESSNKMNRVGIYPGGFWIDTSKILDTRLPESEYGWGFTTLDIARGFFGIYKFRFGGGVIDWHNGTSRKGFVFEISLKPIFILFATYPTIAFIRGPLRRYRRRKRGLCLKCGYNLTGNTTGICSECGAGIKP